MSALPGMNIAGIGEELLAYNNLAEHKSDGEDIDIDIETLSGTLQSLCEGRLATILVQTMAVYMAGNESGQWITENLYEQIPALLRKLCKELDDGDDTKTIPHLKSLVTDVVGEDRNDQSIGSVRGHVLAVDVYLKVDDACRVFIDRHVVQREIVLYRFSIPLETGV